jgi:hypothetical protein
MEYVHFIGLVASAFNIVFAVFDKNWHDTLGWITASCLFTALLFK